MFTEELFNGIKAKGGSGTVYEVKFSMLEIYNEVVRDLLDPKGGQKKGGLKVLDLLQSVWKSNDSKSKSCGNLHVL